MILRSSMTSRLCRSHFYFGSSLLLAGFWIAVGSGCTTPGPTDSARVGPFFKPKNFVGEPHLPADLRRVVLLPVSGGSLATPEAVAALDPVFLSALQRENRFEVVALSREECRRRFGVDELGSARILPYNLIPVLRSEFAADAVMFVDLTSYRAYRPLEIGLRIKLATTNKDAPRVIWSFDNIFAAANPAVANSARHHFIETDRGSVPADLSPAVLQSPSRFAEYASAAAFKTLPPVAPPPPPPAPPAKEVNRGAVAK